MDISHAGQPAAKPGPSAVLVVALTVLLGALRGIAGAQPASPDLIVARSSSGQFVVYAGRSPPHPTEVLTLSTNKDFVRLEPTLLTVSCERIKQALMRELGVTEPWRGTVYFLLHPARAPAETVTISAESIKGGWQYWVDFPDILERTRYVRVIVQVLLLELANRTAEKRSAELPLWLVEGLTELLRSSSEVELILIPPHANPKGFNYTATTVDARKHTFRQQAQQKLRGRPPLTFENLSWPAEDPSLGDVSDLYRGSAQLFVGELLRLPNGRGCLQAMLAQLPQRYNWQFAFLNAFNAFFSRPLDVEKWWALSVAQATGRDITPAWTREESWQKLAQTIHAPAQVRFGTNELPVHAEVPLQTVIREWDSARQSQALNDTRRELMMLRMRIDQDFVGLVQDYYQVIQSYLLQRDQTVSVFSSKKAVRRRAVETAVQHLDALDARREALRPALKPVAEGQPPASPSPKR